MFDTSEQLIIEQSGEIFVVSQISWKSCPWRQLSLVNDEEVISLSHAKVHVFSDSVLCLGKVNQNPASNNVLEAQLGWFEDSPQYRTLETIDGEPMKLEWNILSGFTTLQLVDEVQKFINKMGDPAQFQGRIIFMSMFNDIKWGTTDNEKECIAHATLVSLFAKKISSRTLVIPRTWTRNKVGEWDRVAYDDQNRKKRTDTQFSEPRVRSLEERSKAKEVKNYQYTSVPMEIRLKLFFAKSFLSIISRYLRSSLRFV